ncbi:MAG: TMEM43 family protein [Arenicella sp.]
MATKKKKGNPVVVGLIMLGGAIAALWQNEHRFDYHKAASETAVVERIHSLEENNLFSHTGDMDQGLVIKGEYVEKFTGYLQVRRRAEIYAWERDEDDDGVTWSKKWMSSLESNSRNKGLTKEFLSQTFKPGVYQVGQLDIEPREIQFVDDSEVISPRRLTLTSKGASKQFTIRQNYFYRSKNGQLGGEKLGDERLSFSSIPVPETATYFGKWDGENAVKHQAEIKDGFIAGIISDTGILHHLVAGDRATALATIKAHIERLKNIVRLVGLIVATIGGGLLFSGLTKFLLFIPVIGNAVNTVSGWIGMFLGFLIGVFTIALAFFSSHPIVMVALILLIGIGMYFLRQNADKKRLRLKEQLREELGYSPSDQELKELEYIKLWQLFANDASISQSEQKRLDRWAKRNRFSMDKVSMLTERARKELTQKVDQIESLKALIRLSLADGTIDRKEFKTLRQAASFSGIQRRELSSLINQAQTS